MKKLLVGMLFTFTALSAQNTQEQLNAFKKSTQPTCVKVTASWCGPCRAMEPVLDKVKVAFKDKVAFETFSVENLMKGTDEGVTALQKEFNITIKSIPTFLLFKDGKLVKVLIGSRDEANLTEWFNKLLTTSTETLLKEEREDVPEQVRKALEGPNKADLIKAKEEIEMIRDFLTDPEKHKALHPKIIESNVLKQMGQSITMLENHIQQIK